MANTTLPGTGTGTADIVVATDQISGAEYQRVKLSLGASGTAADAGVGEGAATGALRVDLATDGTVIGIVTETAPTTDTASSGLNGRLQRIAQRLTSAIALLPGFGTAGTPSANVVSVQGVASGTVVTASGPLTDTELRATAVPVAGDVAHDAVDSGNPVKVGGKASGPAPAVVASGDRVDAYFNVYGEQVMALSAAATDTGTQAPGQFRDGAATPISRPLATVPLGWSGAQFNYWRNNVDGTLLASAARTATTSTADLTNYNGQRVWCALNVTVEGAATLSLKLQGKDSISGNYYDVVDFGVVYTAASDAPPVTRAFIVGPGVITADLIGIAGATGATGKAGFVPRTYRWVVTHADATTTTYSLSGGEAS